MDNGDSSLSLRSSSNNILQGNNVSFNAKGLLLAGHSSNNTLQNNTEDSEKPY